MFDFSADDTNVSPPSIRPSLSNPAGEALLIKAILFRNKSVLVQSSELQHMLLSAGDNLEVISEQRGSDQGAGLHHLAAMSGLISDLCFLSSYQNSSIQLKLVGFVSVWLIL